jgi:hypothetical protein
MPDDEQHSFEKQFQLLCRKTMRNRHKMPGNIEAIWNPVKSEVSNAVVVAAAVKTEVYPQRDFIVQHFGKRAMKETGAERALVILVDVELGHWPYSGIYLLDNR